MSGGEVDLMSDKIGPNNMIEIKLDKIDKMYGKSVKQVLIILAHPCDLI